MGVCIDRCIILTGKSCNFSKGQSLLQIHYRSDPDLKEEQKDSIRWFYGACMSACMPLDFVQVSSSVSQNSSRAFKL